MGGAQSIDSIYNKSGGIYIHLPKHTYCPGEIVSGTIHVSLNQHFSPCILILKLSGKERTHWIERRGEGGGYYFGKPGGEEINLHFIGHITIINTSFQLMALENPLQPGGFSVPFSFTLPQNLPGSFSLDIPDTDAEIRYDLTAKLVGNADTLKGKERIFIIQYFNEYQTDLKLKKNFLLKHLCCIKGGELKLNVFFPKNLFYINETIKCYIDIDNTLGKLKIKRIHARIYCSIMVAVNTGKKKYLNTE